MQNYTSLLLIFYKIAIGFLPWYYFFFQINKSSVKFRITFGISLVTFFNQTRLWEFAFIYFHLVIIFKIYYFLTYATYKEENRKHLYRGVRLTFSVILWWHSHLITVLESKLIHILMTHNGKTYIEGSSSNAYFITKKFYVMKVIYGVACIASVKSFLGGNIYHFLGEIQ